MDSRLKIMTITGKGNFPFNSCWLNTKKMNGVLKKWLSFGDTDQSMKNIMEDWFFDSEGAPSYYGILKRWTGAAWVKEPLKVFISTWQTKPLKRYDSTWKVIDTTGV